MVRTKLRKNPSCRFMAQTVVTGIVTKMLTTRLNGANACYPQSNADKGYVPVMWVLKLSFR